MTRPDAKLTTWADVRGSTGRDAKLAVRDGRCTGWLFDSTAIQGDLRVSEWHD